MGKAHCARCATYSRPGLAYATKPPAPTRSMAAARTRAKTQPALMPVAESSESVGAGPFVPVCGASPFSQRIKVGLRGTQEDGAAANARRVTVVAIVAV